MRKEENFVDYGKYLRCSIPRFWRILQEERVKGTIKTWHHVFTGKLKKGAWTKKNWSKNRLEEEFKDHGLDMNEGAYLAASIHCVLNQLLRNSSPPAIFANLNGIFDSTFIDRSTKECFTKLVLYVVEDKLERRILNREYLNLEEINEFVENVSRKSLVIHMDVNDGNKRSIEYIMSLFNVTREDIVHFLNRNFLLKDWPKYPEELWDLYLR